jgi:hypothetical protein
MVTCACFDYGGFSGLCGNEKYKPAQGNKIIYMFKKVWKYIFDSSVPESASTEKLTVKERLRAFKNLPLFLN